MNVLLHGVTGNGTTDDTAALQACLNAAAPTGETVYLPAVTSPTYPQVGGYRITAPLNVPNFVRITGDGMGTVLKGEHAGAIFQSPSINGLEWDHMAIRGLMCWGLKQTDPANYTQRLHAHHLYFHRDLFRCIDGNLIVSTIEDSSFGELGNAAQYHSHIVSQGSGGNQSNHNLVRRNRMFNATKWSVYFADGYGVVLDGNNMEGNACAPVQIHGMFMSVITNGHHERNVPRADQPQCEIIYTNGNSANRVSIVERTWFNPHANVTHLADFSGAGAVRFRDITSSSMGGKWLTNGQNAYVDTLSWGHWPQ